MNRESQIVEQEVTMNQASARPPTPFPMDSMEELEKVCINFIENCSNFDCWLNGVEKILIISFRS
jgi:hypothetical protein